MRGDFLGDAVDETLRLQSMGPGFDLWAPTGHM